MTDIRPTDAVTAESATAPYKHLRPLPQPRGLGSSEVTSDDVFLSAAREHDSTRNQAAAEPSATTTDEFSLPSSERQWSKKVESEFETAAPPSATSLAETAYQEANILIEVECRSRADYRSTAEPSRGTEEFSLETAYQKGACSDVNKITKAPASGLAEGTFREISARSSDEAMAAQHRKLAGSSDLETSQHSQELASQRSESTFQGIEFDSSSKAPTEEAVEKSWKTSSSATTERHERVPQLLQEQETLTLPSVKSEEASVPTSRVPHKKREELQAQVEVVTKPQDEESTDLTSEEALIPKSKQYISPLRTSPQGHHMPEQSVELEEISASSELMIELPERVGSETSMKRSSEGPVGATSIESLATKYASDGSVKQTHLPDVSQSAETKKAPVLATRTSCQPV
ncbi:hypothetical protein HPB51_021290 [Rhipicephalus microplus]|uniref:Uncharacterized protein n=1 Tax=Rhipicephalus microplus TaxID=6941 RepID=A0A9J6F625_RHIMP|nr:hypothetical protein HPB51_021290 [Rhipicephalus microplus]